MENGLLVCVVKTDRAVIIICIEMGKFVLVRGMATSPPASIRLVLLSKRLT